MIYYIKREQGFALEFHGNFEALLVRFFSAVWRIVKGLPRRLIDHLAAQIEANKEYYRQQREAWEAVQEDEEPEEEPQPVETVQAERVETPKTLFPAVEKAIEPKEPTPAVPLDSPPLLFNSYWQKRQHDEQAMREELGYLQAKRSGYLELTALAEAERDDSMTTAARRATLQRQILALGDKVFKIDQRMDQLHFQLNPYIPA